MDGAYRALAWVVSVMLPPMAIFFPLFTLLEDLGYLPRVAFVMDRAFQRCRACGKQALTMCMGLGCNAVGVTGCRIIDSPRERAPAGHPHQQPDALQRAIPAAGERETPAAGRGVLFPAEGEGHRRPVPPALRGQ